MPTYNRKHCIKNAINSLLAQTYQDFELIIIDDGSTDGTHEYICNTYPDEIKDKRVRYIRLPRNKGAAFARNEGLKAAKNDWIAYLDTDNKMKPDFLESFAAVIVVDGKTKIFYAQLQTINSKKIIGKSFDFEELIISNYIDLGVFIHNSSLFKELGGFNIKLNRLIDWDLIIRYTEIYQPKFIGKVLLDYYDGLEFKRISNGEIHGDNYKEIIINYLRRLSVSDFVQRYQKYFTWFKQKEYEVTGLNESILQRDALIKIKNSQILVKDQEIEAQNRVFDLAKEQIRSLEIQLGMVKSDFNSAKSQVHLVGMELTSTKAQLDLVNTQLGLTQIQLSYRVNELHEIYSSRGWMAIAFLRKISRVLVPKGSVRRKFFSFLFRLYKKSFALFFRIRRIVFDSERLLELSKATIKKKLPSSLKRIIKKSIPRGSAYGLPIIGPDGNRISIKEDFPHGRKTVIFVDNNVPTYDKDAGSRTVYQYMKLFLSIGFNVVFIPDNFCQLQPYTSELENLGIKVLYGPWYYENWERWLVDNKESIDYFFLNRAWNSVKYLELIRKDMKAKVIYYPVDITYIRELRQYEITKEKSLLKEIENHKILESYMFKNSDVVITISEYEKDVLSKEFPGVKVFIIPTFIYDCSFPIMKGLSLSDRRDLLFVGGFVHKPNVDGVKWFVSKIFPLIKEAVPGIKINIIGSNPPEDVRNLTSEDVRILGFVSDKELEEHYSKTRLVVAPLRYGAGVKGKIIESVAYGIPVVTTPVGAEGIADKENILLVGDNEQNFAKKVIEAYNNNELWNFLRSSEIKYAKSFLSEENARRVIKNILKKV